MDLIDFKLLLQKYNIFSKKIISRIIEINDLNHNFQKVILQLENNLVINPSCLT